MKIYLAPLENITTTEYRNTIYRQFGSSIDSYFTPFFMPHIKRSLDAKDKRRLDRLENEVPVLIPQILTDDPEAFWRMADGMINLGYKEINLNIGCPSQRVSGKGRGAGLLARKEQLDRFLYEVFEKNSIDLSIKTRLGMREPDEFYELLDIYNKYPLKELIIHVRTGVQKYGGEPQREYFYYALAHSKNPICYNGDIYTKKDYDDLLERIGNTPYSQKMCAVMIGRGLLANPALAREIKGGDPVSGDEILTFMESYREKFLSFPRKNLKLFLMNKSKEILSFMKVHYPDNKEELSRMFSCKDYEEYLRLEQRFFDKKRI